MRRTLPFILLLAVLAPAAPTAEAQDAAIELVMDDDGLARYFQREGGGERNPTLVVRAGSTVPVRVTNTGSLDHNFQVGAPATGGTPCCQSPGESATTEIGIPADATGELRYWCVLHRASGMEGVLRVQPARDAPTLRIVRPAEGATVPAEFTVRVEAENVSLGTTHHLHYIVDGREGAEGWDTAETTFTARIAEAGFHHVRVVLVDAAHQPVTPRVEAERIVYVDPQAPPEAPTATMPSPTPADPADADTPAPGALALLVTAALVARAASWRRRAPP